jgi:SNF2 family DNA or RNA helicase
MALTISGVSSPASPPERDPDRDWLAWGPLVERLDRTPRLSPEDASLVEAALEVWTKPGFDTFVSLPRLRFEPFEHQLQAAGRVLRGLHGRAILADEVGLGKTIEAGLVLSELRARGLANRVLVLTPAGLVGQWRDEMDRKFALPTEIAGGRRWQVPRSADMPIVLASIPSARRPPLRDTLVSTSWDLVVCDEAHRVKNPRSASGRLVRDLRAHYLLLLTATPVENRLDDIYQLVNLVRPGLLGTPGEFRRRHGKVGGRAGGEAEPARDITRLRSGLREVMVRHRRSEVALMLPRRLARTRVVAPDPAEAALYRDVSERVRSEGRRAAPNERLALQALQRLAGSSPQALAASLSKVGWADLAERAAATPSSAKEAALTEVLSGHGAHGEKVVVFTGFRANLDALAVAATRLGMRAAVYHGGLPRAAKDAAIEAFREDVPVLVSTEAAGEGRNLQFCHAMVNFDLPWNPMQIEQRLGRLHRIGQNHDVVLTNLVCKHTIEERVLRVLEAKLNLFELVVGELDMILGRIDEDFDFERAVFDAHLSSRDDQELEQRLDALGDEVAAARLDYESGRSRVDALVGDDQ